MGRDRNLPHFHITPHARQAIKLHFIDNQDFTKNNLVFLRLSEKLRIQTDFRQNPGKNGLIFESECVSYTLAEML